MPGGNAKQFDWSIIDKSQVNKQFFLSGGLTLDNIENAVNTGITNFFDVSSGVESNPGVKDTEKLKKFINLNQTENEKKFRLEQLRALDNGIPIDVMYTQNSPIGVDTMDDFMEIKKIMEYKKD